jgi:hypothetical protein
LVDHLAVEFQHEAQYSARRRMLRPEIEREIAQGGLTHRGLASAAPWGNARPLMPVPSGHTRPAGARGADHGMALGRSGDRRLAVGVSA